MLIWIHDIHIYNGITVRIVHDIILNSFIIILFGWQSVEIVYLLS